VRSRSRSAGSAETSRSGGFALGSLDGRRLGCPGGDSRFGDVGSGAGRRTKGREGIFGAVVDGSRSRRRAVGLVGRSSGLGSGGVSVSKGGEGVRSTL